MMTRKDDDESPDLGACCCCEREDQKVRNWIGLEQKAPVPGSGWGCFQCGLPMDGAVALVCDECLQIGKPILFAIAGPPVEKKRVPIRALSGEHKHDESKHLEVREDPELRAERDR